MEGFERNLPQIFIVWGAWLKRFSRFSSFEKVEVVMRLSAIMGGLMADVCISTVWHWGWLVLHLHCSPCVLSVLSELMTWRKVTVASIISGAVHKSNVFEGLRERRRRINIPCAHIARVPTARVSAWVYLSCRSLIAIVFCFPCSKQLTNMYLFVRC